MSEVNLKSKKPKKYRKNLTKVNFDEEIVTKSRAEHIIQENGDTIAKEQLKTLKSSIPQNAAAKKKQKKGKASKDETPVDKESRAEKRKLTPQEESAELALLVAAPATNEVIDSIDKSQEESIRAKKRKKYQDLRVNSKNKSEQAIQRKCINYLSKWKHSRSDWKFEKLKQVWLQQNMFDDSKLPEKFWEILVEYFSNAKGQIRNTIIKETTSIIEAADVEAKEEEESCKVKRARSIMQFLQD